jgi:predicted RNA binding protein YcfA (HicA-like mRNA interferase family)
LVHEIRGEQVKTSELLKIFRKNGVTLVSHGREHDKYYSPVTGKYIRVPRHRSKEIPTGTSDRILKDAGLK